MDIIAHGLWAAAPFYCKRRSRKILGLAFMFGMLPDLFAFLPHIFQMATAHGLGPLMHRPPVEMINPVVFRLYDISHSLVIFAAVFGLVYLLRKGKPSWVMSGWGLHILLDIPTHSASFFPTPFLWPLSEFMVNGTPWSQLWFIVLNYACLMSVYTFLYWRRKKKFAGVETSPRPA